MMRKYDLLGFYKFLGLAKKAGKLATGDAKVTNAIQKGHDVLTIIAEDASLNTIKRFTNMLKFRNRQYVLIGSKEELSKCIGECNKAVLVVLDEGFSKKLCEILQSIGAKVSHKSKEPELTELKTVNLK